MNTLTIDIETVPLDVLTETQQEELDKKITSYKRFNEVTSENIEDVTSLLMGTNPYFGKIVCIGIKQTMASGAYDEKAIVGTEKEILCEFWRVLSKFPQGLFITYNGLSFDVPFILKRSMVHKLVPTNKPFLDTRRFSKYPHFDVKAVLSDFDRYNSCTLKLACEHLGIPSPKEGEIAAKDVAKAFKQGRIDAIAEYCLKDVQATFDAYKIIKKYTFIR